MFGVAGDGAHLLAARGRRVVVEVLQHALLDPGDRLRRQAVVHDRRLAQDRIADVALQREAVAEQLLADLRRAVGADERRPMPPKLKPPPPPPNPPPPPALKAPIIVDSKRAAGRGSRIVV